MEKKNIEANKAVREMPVLRIKGGYKFDSVFNLIHFYPSKFYKTTTQNQQCYVKFKP